MVNASNLAAAAGAAAGAVAGASAGLELGTASVRRTAVRETAGATSAQQASGIGTFLLEFLARRGLAAAAGGGVMKARGRTAAVPGYAGASGAPRRAASASPPSAASRAATSKTATSTSRSSSSLSFLSDPKLSIEEKLMRLMAYLNGKYEKEMQAKMDEIAGKKTTTSSSQKKSSGFLGKIASAVSSVVGDGALSAVDGFMKIPGVKTALKSVAGPVLAAGATALGFPAAAPVLLRYGAQAVDAVASVAGASSSGGSGTSSSGGTTSSTSGTDGKTDQLAMMEIQRLMDKQKEMFSLVSNILKAGHDTRMAAINNVR